MYNKNTQQNYHNFMANSFNKKKTIENDAERFKNIHKKTTQIKQINFTKKNTNNDKSIKPTEDIYKLNDIKLSTNISFNFINENLTQIPKIKLKDIIITNHNINDSFDFNNRNNISVPIQNMNVFSGREFNEGNVNRLKNKKITTICQVYQQKYAYNINVTGFGDFIRGCFFTLQFCSKYLFNCEILIQHPVAVFLKKFQLSFSNSFVLDKLLSKTNSMFTQSNLKDTIFNENNNIDGFILSNKPLTDYIDYLCNLKVVNNSIYSFNILFPYDNISFKECETLQSILEPTDEMKSYVDETLKQIGFTSKKYIIIQVRSGDVYLKNETKIFNSNYFKVIKNEISQIIKNNSENNDFLLIADNNEIKYLICEEFPNIKAFYKDITHLGEGFKLEREKVKNTLLDFYLMANSDSIFSSTVYLHGSGFSYWCSKVYNIPHKCKYISIK